MQNQNNLASLTLGESNLFFGFNPTEANWNNQESMHLSHGPNRAGQGQLATFDHVHVCTLILFAFCNS